MVSVMTLSAFEIVLIYHNCLVGLQFELLDEVGICIMPMGRTSSIFLPS